MQKVCKVNCRRRSVKIRTKVIEMAEKKECDIDCGVVKVAVYARLSVNEHGERDDSLNTQRSILTEYVKSQGLGEPIIYEDSDISGTCFDRPGLVRMVGDINCGRVDALVVKDLSRLGRNNGETLTFLDYLQEKNVRLISLGDGYDSFHDDDDTIGIRTWVNEYYARDISKKVRANLKKKMQNGEYLGRPPFGYRKSGCCKNKLEVDERYRELINELFTLYIQGWGYRALAGFVQRLGVPTPGQDKGYARAPAAGQWEGQHIRRIITNRVYCGDTVQGVREKVSFKSRKIRRVPNEKWIVVPGTHEPIVNRDTFELAQRVRRKRWLVGAGRKNALSPGAHLFTGLIFCAACGSRHVYRRKVGRPGGYVCGRYNRQGRPGCSSHHVTEAKLVGLIRRDVLEMGAGVPFRDKLNERYENELAARDESKRPEKLAREIENRQRQLKTIYMDKIRGYISEALFLETKITLQREITILMQQYENALAVAEGNCQQQCLKVIDHLALELLNDADIDRLFLEMFVKKIFVLEHGDIMSEQLNKDNDLCPMLSNLEIKKQGEAEHSLIIVYNLEPIIP